jgi:hypothetical protein
MVLLGYVYPVEARLGLFGDSVNLGQDWCMVCAECTTCTEIFGHTRWYSKVTWVKW